MVSKITNWGIKTIDWGVNHPRSTALLLGGMIGLPFVYYDFWPLSMVAIVLAFYIFKKVVSTELVVALPLLVFTKMLIVLSWYWGTLPLSWIGDLSTPTQVLSVVLYWVSSAVWLSSAGLVLAVAIGFGRRLSIKLPSVLIPLMVGLVVVVSEYLGAVIFSVLTIGQGAYISGNFSFGHTGLLFPWLYPIASFGGVYLVGWFGVSLILAISLAFQYRQYVQYLSIALLILFYAFSAHSLVYDGIVTKISLIETNSKRLDSQTAGITFDRGLELEEMVARALPNNPDYVLLPEDSRYLEEVYKADVAGVDMAVSAWGILHPTSTAIILDSGRTTLSDGSVVQRAYLFNSSKDGAYYEADKQYLVPQGEYLPSFYATVMRLSGLSEVVDILSKSINYVTGSASISKDAPSSIPNVLFCFESVSPIGAKKLTWTRPDTFIVHPMSHAWFNNKQVLEAQLETMLVFQAVWAGVPIVSVGNETRGVVYTPNGEIVYPKTSAYFPYGELSEVTILRPFPRE